MNFENKLIFETKTENKNMNLPLITELSIDYQ